MVQSARWGSEIPQPAMFDASNAREIPAMTPTPKRWWRLQAPVGLRCIREGGRALHSSLRGKLMALCRSWERLGNSFRGEARTLWADMDHCGGGSGPSYFVAYVRSVELFRSICSKTVTLRPLARTVIVLGNSTPRKKRR